MTESEILQKVKWYLSSQSDENVIASCSIIPAGALYQLFDKRKGSELISFLLGVVHLVKSSWT